MVNYKRNVEELKDKAVFFWTKELIDEEASISVIPTLLNTQSKFISILDVADSSPIAWKLALNLTQDIYPNLFLKHLMVISDIGAEPLKNNDFKSMFPQKTMTYIWKNKSHDYTFQKLLDKPFLNSSKLCVDGKGLIKPCELTPLLEDVIMLLMYAGVSTDESVDEGLKDKCIIGSLLGKRDELEQFIKQRYIWVSRITAGATSNSMGQLAQRYVLKKLQDKLPTWTLSSNGSIPGVSHNNGKTDMSFDIVVCSPQNKWCAIEVSFQFTTNSTIERKSGQAQSRADLIKVAGHKIAYVIDGAGNFKRSSALRTICNYSDCTVAFSPDEIEVLSEFLKTSL
ncbi:hypothetical protein [Aliterella atlantica]|uniref:Restriction endonuclease n=1 Tax=Aliterella atlantica CENA595 TaxID=1618023 RepID=A0A0D8ZNV6_9CYAN|nr:hypothetical protein [Aliterella atlantica]KJH70425.1 hypothetical protein UH38_18360 [Aliterella atlantica CENA595]